MSISLQCTGCGTQLLEHASVLASACSLWEKRTARAPATAGQPAFWVSVYPEVSQVFHRILSTAGESACTKTSDLPLHFFPFDRDVLSMHRPQVLKELLTDSNPAALDETALVCAPCQP